MTINLPGDANNKGTIRILSQNGQLVKTMAVTNQSRIDLNVGKPGVYIAQVVMGKQIVNKKIVVIR